VAGFVFAHVHLSHREFATVNLACWLTAYWLDQNATAAKPAASNPRLNHFVIAIPPFLRRNACDANHPRTTRVQTLTRVEI
jgi:hypothetical protein